jgi:cytochrome oxidase Cu insertion factor (SCO1/SenC/PrrC family)
MLKNQHGKEARFYTDLIKGKLVAINFIFTTCTTICPPMGANFAKLRTLVGEDVHLISVSVDPKTDTPERLKTWSEQFQAKSGWTLLTGSRRDVDGLLKALGAFTADKWDHTPVVLIGNEATGQWARANGLAAPTKLAEIINGLKGPVSSQLSAQPDSPAHRYFTDVTLVNQNGEPMRLYSDLLKGRVVVINAFFASCQGTCPVMAATLVKIQNWLGDRLGKDVFLISISVDPETDTPAKLKEYAERFNGKPGWYLLTGTKENVELALHKLGQYVERREDHLNLMIIGNEPTGLWKKAFGLAKPEEIIRIVADVLNDRKN